MHIQYISPQFTFANRAFRMRFLSSEMFGSGLLSCFTQVAISVIAKTFVFMTPKSPFYNNIYSQANTLQPNGFGLVASV